MNTRNSETESGKVDPDAGTLVISRDDGEIFGLFKPIGVHRREILHSPRGSRDRGGRNLQTAGLPCRISVIMAIIGEVLKIIPIGVHHVNFSVLHPHPY